MAEAIDELIRRRYQAVRVQDFNTQFRLGTLVTVKGANMLSNFKFCDDYLTFLKPYLKRNSAYIIHQEETKEYEIGGSVSGLLGIFGITISSAIKHQAQLGPISCDVYTTDDPEISKEFISRDAVQKYVRQQILENVDVYFAFNLWKADRIIFQSLDEKAFTAEFSAGKTETISSASIKGVLRFKSTSVVEADFDPPVPLMMKLSKLYLEEDKNTVTFRPRRNDIDGPLKARPIRPLE